MRQTIRNYIEKHTTLASFYTILPMWGIFIWAIFGESTTAVRLLTIYCVLITILTIIVSTKPPVASGKEETE